ncbi:coiled-coil protein [Tasmannia lanceolata]|uniref:coiled-coil protein n=1 Tax=Tasmannia lanceolata TaxID=3420 RepID=UPI0040643130
MDEAQEILLNSLESSGISLPNRVSSIQDLTPDVLISICSQSLRLIDDSSSFPISLPDSMAERFKICTEIASSIKNLGYRGDLSFHQFLYPSDEDSYKLVRFLVERLSKTSEGGTVSSKVDIMSMFLGTRPLVGNQENQSGEKAPPLITHQEDPRSSIGTSILEFNELRRLKLGFPESPVTEAEDVIVHRALEPHLIPEQTDESSVGEVFGLSSLEFNEKEGLRGEEKVGELLEESGKPRTDATANGESVPQRKHRHVIELEQKLGSLLEQSSKMRFEVEDLQRQEKTHIDELSRKTSEAQHLEDELELLKAAVEMAFDDQHPDGYYIKELNERVKARTENLLELELQWDDFKRPLDEKKMSLQQSLHEQTSEVQEKLLHLEKVELETEATIAEILKRQEEHSKLSAELKNQSKTASRKSYIERITEITKNSKKQDADIERILQETRQLQIESNSIQDRLHRTYALVDETVFRDAKNDPVRRQAYRLLTSIHGSFEQISDKILATDRARREAAELEAKLAAMVSRSFDIDKLQADLDAIKKENDLLEQQLLHN